MHLNGCTSKSRDLVCGVPQGSCLRPSLFAVFINDLAWGTERAEIMFNADDSTLYYAAPLCSKLNDVLNKELQILHDLISCNKLVLNGPKAF